MPSPRLHPYWSYELLALQSAATELQGDIEKLMHVVVDRALRVVRHADGALIDIRDLNERECKAASGIAADYLGYRFKRDPAALTEECMATGRSKICADAQNDPRVDNDACKRAGIGSLVMVPILYDGAAIGTLKLLSAQKNAFGEEELLITQLLAGPLITSLAASERDDAHRALERMGTRFQATFEQAAVGMAHVAPDGRFLLVNDRFCEVVGHEREKLVSGDYQNITHEEDLAEDLANVESLLKGEVDCFMMEKRYIRADGSTVWANLTVSLIRDADRRPDFFVAVVEDISRRKDAEQRALHDPLTGLPNRRWLNEYFRTAFDHGAVHPTVVAYLDLDGFKSVNDLFGHAEGDRCLTDVATCLESVIRDRDRICRIAGDEFVLLMPDTTKDTALELIEGFRQSIKDLCAERPWKIGVSAGAVVVDAQRFSGLDDILEAADQLMYQAKRKSGSTTIIRDAGDDYIAA